MATRGQTGIWLDSMDSGEARQILPDATNAAVAEPPAGGRVGAILFSRSRGGGVQARWRRDGRELFYISPDWKMMAVDVGTGAALRSGTPHALFDTDMVDTGIRTGPISWDIAPDGKRFLITSPNSAGTTSLNVALNWQPSRQ